MHYDIEKRAAAAKGGRSSAAPASMASFAAYRSSHSTRAVEQISSRIRPNNPQLVQTITTAFGPG